MERNNARLHGPPQLLRDSGWGIRRDLCGEGGFETGRLATGRRWVRRQVHAVLRRHNRVLCPLHPHLRLRHAEPGHRGYSGQLPELLWKRGPTRQRRRLHAVRAGVGTDRPLGVLLHTGG